MTIYCHNDSEMNVLCITFIDTDNRVRIWGEDRGNGKRGEPDSNLHDPHRHSLKTFLIHLSQNFMPFYAHLLWHYEKANSFNFSTIF